MSNSPIFTQPVYFMPNVVPLTVPASVVSLNVNSIPLGASGIIVANAVGAGSVNWLFGVNPTASLGFPLSAGEIEIFEDINNFTDLRFIRNGASDGTLTFQFIATKNIR